MWRSSWHRRCLLFLPLLFFVFLLLVLSSLSTFRDPLSLFFDTSSSSSSAENKIANNSTNDPSIIWSTRRAADWRPCGWWKRSNAHPSPEALPAAVGNNGYIRVDCYGGLNQMRRDFCDGIGIARLLNATLVLPKFEVAAYWNESSGFADVFDVDYFIKQTRGFVQIVKEVPEEIESSEPYRVDCSKRKGSFDYIETILPVLLKRRFISITPAMSQRGDRHDEWEWASRTYKWTADWYCMPRGFNYSLVYHEGNIFFSYHTGYPLWAKAAVCQGCYNALRLNKALEVKGSKLLAAIPKPFISLHLRFEPDMVAYSQCDYTGLKPESLSAIEAARGDRRPWTGDTARVWRNRGKCPLTPKETAFILQALNIPTNTTIYLASGDGVMEIEGFTNVYANVYTKSSLLNREDFLGMHGNTKAALDYYVSINSDAYISTYFGNMDKMVSAMRALNGLYKTLALNRRAFANHTSEGLRGKELAEAMLRVHAEDFAVGRGSALPFCFCEFFL